MSLQPLIPLVALALFLSAGTMTYAAMQNMKVLAIFAAMGFTLIVVIIGGLGSIKGAAAGSLLYGMVTAFSPAYLPADYTFYSIIFTFVILAVVLAVRPAGLFPAKSG